MNLNTSNLQEHLNAVFAPAGAIVAVWTIADVQEAARQLHCPELTDEQAKEVLDIVLRNYDKHFGITTITIKVAIDAYLDTQKQTHVVEMAGTAFLA